MKQHRMRLNEQHRFTIRCSLMMTYNAAMRHLDFTDEYAGAWIRDAGRAWEAYKAVSGFPPNYGESPR